MKLEDRVAIVTGAAQGIGRAVAEKLDAEGATVVIADLNAEGAQTAVGALERGQGIECDVSLAESVEAMVAEVLDDHGKVDVLVNNWAIVSFILWVEGDLGEWQWIICTSFSCCYLSLRSV